MTNMFLHVTSRFPRTNEKEFSDQLQWSSRKKALARGDSRAGFRLQSTGGHHPVSRAGRSFASQTTVQFVNCLAPGPMTSARPMSRRRCATRRDSELT